MAKKSVGYVELEWHCPSCGSKNPGLQKTCQSCGMPQPDNVEFNQASQEKLITDEAAVAKIKAGADIHCRYCGSRNSAEAKTCSQCGADLSEGAKRASGQVLGAQRTGPAEKINCPACGTPNEPNAPKCEQCGASLITEPAQPAPVQAAPTKPKNKLAIIAGVVVVLALCACIGAFFIFSSRTEEVTGAVNDVSWSRSTAIEGLTPVTREDWRDEIPADSEVGSCTEQVRHTQDEPAPNAREVCGTPYVVDTGTGAGEVVQDCQYEVLESYCEYQVYEWQKVDTEELTGNDFTPTWPNPVLGSNQRAGQRVEKYIITFTTDKGEYTYTIEDANVFNQFQIGSRWRLQINGFNSVTGVEPVN
jgi:DNA-directed RNA polymerase subunit RPC12/RpoP